MAAQTGNTYISGTIGSVEIPTTSSSNKVSPNDCEFVTTTNKRKATWPLTPEIFVSVENHLGAGKSWPDTPKNCDLCEKKHRRYKRY